MDASLDHDWDLSWDEARRVQRRLAEQVSCGDDFGPIQTVAGIDLAYPRTATGVVTGRAAVVVLAFPGLALHFERSGSETLSGVFKRLSGLQPGVITSLLGGPFFVYLLLRQGRALRLW